MKTFLIVALYTGMVTALDLGGAWWEHVCGTQPNKGTVISVGPAATSVKSGSAILAVGTNPSDT